MGQQGSKGANGFGSADPNAPTMKAWVATAPSPSAATLSNVTIMTNVPIPTPSTSQVRVKIHSASLNRVDIGRATSVTCPFPAILGTDGAGIVEKLGDEANAAKFGIAVGDRVYFHLETGNSTAGTFAEYCTVELSCLSKIEKAVVAQSAVAADEAGVSPSTPSTAAIMSFNEAATMPSAGWTAFIALFDKLKIESGRVIFIDGAAGGVGSYAVKMCKMMGLFVIGTCSTYNVEYLTSLGVDVVVDYVMDDIPSKLREWTQSRGVDYFLELVSPEQGEKFAKHIRFGGALCLVGGSIKSSQQELLFLNQISVHHVNLNGMHRDQITWPLLAYLGNQCAQMIDNKSITPCYNEVIPFEQAQQALVQLGQGHARGKIVLRVVEPTRKGAPTTATPKTTTAAPVVSAETAADTAAPAPAGPTISKANPPPPIVKPATPEDNIVIA